MMGPARSPLNPVSPQVPFGVVSCRLQWERWHSSRLKRTNTAGQSSICLLCFCSRNKRWWDWREEKGRETARSSADVPYLSATSQPDLLSVKLQFVRPCFCLKFLGIQIFSLHRKCRTGACLEVKWSTPAQKVLTMSFMLPASHIRMIVFRKLVDFLTRSFLLDNVVCMHT